MGLSQSTLLVLTNESDEDAKIKISEVEDYDWYNTDNPNQLNNSTLKGREQKKVKMELNDWSEEAPYRITFVFPNETEMSFKLRQKGVVFNKPNPPPLARALIEHSNSSRYEWTVARKPYTMYITISETIEQ